MKRISRTACFIYGLIVVIVILSILCLYYTLIVKNMSIVFPFIICLGLSPVLIIYCTTFLGIIGRKKVQVDFFPLSSLYIMPGSLFIYYSAIFMSIFNSIFHNSITNLLYFGFLVPICAYIIIIINKKTKKSSKVVVSYILSLLMIAYYGYLCFVSRFIG